MKKVLFPVLTALIVLFAVNVSFAYGPHDENCVECHSIHQSKGESLPAVYNTTEKYGTGEALKSVDAFCIGCHNKNTGIMPIEIHKTHPVGVAPKKAKVPADYLRKGVFVCVSCHDPHPSN
ncbi:MAG: cytochrome C, partial [Proteobacteria bacterium]|nr:cytochrome C [Pseudomonadota bacterium]